jgi:hypothetical protein
VKAAQLATALKTFGTLMGGSEAVALSKFALVFEGLGDMKAAAVAAQVAKNWKTEGRCARRPAELAKAVGLIEQVLNTVGAKPQAGVLAKVVPLLAGSEHQDVDSFVQEAIAARVKKAPPPKPPKLPKVAKPKFADLAPELAQRLRAAACDRSRFDAVLKEFEESYKATELKVIASRYLGFDVDKKTKEDIVKAVRNWQREEELNSASHASQAKAGL